MLRPPPRTVRAGVQRLAAGVDLPRHLHLESYVTLVLDGAYEQVGYAGRLRPCAGDVLVQPSLDCHADTMLTRGLTLMRLPWRFEPGLGGVWRGLDIDTLRRLAEADATEASACLAAMTRDHAPLAPRCDHWIDTLAARLVHAPQRSIAGWAAESGRSREAVSRRFHAHYGTSPAGFRLEVRTRAAWLRVVSGAEPFAQVALSAGFADQSHMTRAMRWLTGESPGRWRRGAAIDHIGSSRASRRSPHCGP